MKTPQVVQRAAGGKDSPLDRAGRSFLLLPGTLHWVNYAPGLLLWAFEFAAPGLQGHGSGEAAKHAGSAAFQLSLPRALPPSPGSPPPPQGI